MPAVPSRQVEVALRPMPPLNLAALSSDEFLHHLNALNIELQVKGDKLSLNAPAGALTPSLQIQLRRRKSE